MDSQTHHLPRMTDPATLPCPDPVVFEAEVTPHRSLSPRGLRLVIGFVCSISLCTTTLFWTWLNVTLQERPGRVPGLYLSARGQIVEVAALLGEPEKRDLAEALAAAVHRLKNPVFDNPQLREGLVC